MAAYITVGATTTHGGKVISGSPHTTHNGIPISRKGDKVICKKCKKVTTILTGDASFIVDGAPIARAGDVTSCGAKLIAVQQSFCESDNNDRDILFVSFTPFDNEDGAAEGTLVAGNTYAGEPNEGGGGIDRPAYISGTAGTPEELRYQAELEAMYINVGGDETKFRE
ncbi:MAG: PAAR domain-containing protein, partial [Psychrobacter sp.]|nr:PAAR domain-containing protein [Psychrobacter sp.]